MNLPDDLRESLANEELVAVQRWWQSLTVKQQHDLCDASKPDQEYLPLPVPDEPDPDDELSPLYEYLINHEFRVVNFVADAEARSSYRIVSSYIASLGSDYRHGQSGTVQ